MEMFPQLGETQLHVALRKGNYDIELAVAHIYLVYLLVAIHHSRFMLPLIFLMWLKEVKSVKKHCESTLSTSSTGTLEGSSTSSPLCSIIKDFSDGMFDPECPLRI